MPIYLQLYEQATKDTRDTLKVKIILIFKYLQGASDFLAV